MKSVTKFTINFFITLSLFFALQVQAQSLLSGSSSKDDEVLGAFSQSVAMDAYNLPCVSHCEEVTIECLTPEQILERLGNGVLGACNRETCTLTLSFLACNLAGLLPGSKYNARSLFKDNSHFHSDSPYDTQTACFIGHELVHALDPPGIRQCNSEVNAYDHEIGCLQSAYHEHCESNPGLIRVRWEETACLDLKEQIEFKKLASAYNQCICQGHSAQRCFSNCLSTGALVINCRQIDNVYAPPGSPPSKVDYDPFE